jgi:cation:H+ antiporter
MAVDSAQHLANGLQIDPAITGTLAIALGVSLPELTFNLQAAKKGKTEMAVGNVLGCNIFNILFVGGALSLAGTTVPESMSWNSDLGKFNLAALLTSATLMSATLLSGKGSIKKWQGIAGLAVYGAYVAANAGLGGYNYEKPKEPTAIVEKFNQSAPSAPKVKKDISQITQEPVHNNFKLLPVLK